MPDVVWPSSSDVHSAVAERIRRLLDEHGGLVADFGRRTMSLGHGVLSDDPHSFTAVLIPGACLTAGADADPGTLASDSPGVALTSAAGLLSLAGVAVVRVTEDGAAPNTAVALAHLLGTEFAHAANGQAANLQPDRTVDAVTAYLQAAAQSGPLGSLIARLGARTATGNAEIVDLLGQFGRCLAVRSQLLNDARDVAPGAAHLKADVRAGARTVPLAFANSVGAPLGLSAEELAAWETGERARVAAGGGLIAAQALAAAERLRALQALDSLEHLGRPVDGLRALVD